MSVYLQQVDADIVSILLLRFGGVETDGNKERGHIVSILLLRFLSRRPQAQPRRREPRFNPSLEILTVYGPNILTPILEMFQSFS